jgi:RNA polymerase sigma factor (sigma-70 family)
MDNPKEQRKKSLELFKSLQRRDLSEEDRLRLFAYLLALSFGFWQYEEATTPQTLRTWMLSVAGACKRTAIRQGARCDAIDEQALAHDVLLQFYLKTSTIKKDPRNWLIGTAGRMLKSFLRRTGPETFGDEIDAGTMQVAQPAREAESGPDPPEEPPPLGGKVKELHAAIEQLSPRRREVVKRFYFGKQETAAIAREMKIKPDLARKELERGRRDIRRAMTTKK